MKKQEQKQTGIRLHVLTKDANSDLPYIDPNDEINPSLLSMAGTISVPSREEIESDPRLASAFGECL